MYPYPYWIDPIIIVETPTPLVEDAVDVESWGDDELGMGQNDVPVPVAAVAPAPEPKQSKLMTACMIGAGVALGAAGFAVAKKLLG